MEKIIITLTDMAKSFEYDLEVPCDMNIFQLKKEIISSIESYAPGHQLGITPTLLVCNRTKQKLDSEETLSSAGVLNGDYVTIYGV
ncbi:MAG: hypothetical protein ACI39R_06850 [Lachnospiraceae bacterium]